MNKKICIVVLSRANYGRSKSIISAAHNDPDVDLQLVVGASSLIEMHGDVSKIIENDGFKITSKVDFLLSSSSPSSMSTTTGLGIIKLGQVFDILQPDVVITIADRYETMATAIAAAYQNIPLAHVQGGEITGSVDESVRHAITKLSHIHFPSTQYAAENVIKLGESRENVFHVGCPAMDPLFELKPNTGMLDNLTGVGENIDQSKPFYLVVYHPVTTEYGTQETENHINFIIEAAEQMNSQFIWLWPNVDAGSDLVSKKLRTWRENTSIPIRFIKNLPVDEYNNLLSLARCTIGNSSSFIREGSVLGTPGIIVGSRQNFREHSSNIKYFDGKASSDLIDLIHSHSKKRFESSSIYGDGSAGKNIIKVLKKAKLKIQKALVFEKNK